MSSNLGPIPPYSLASDAGTTMTPGFLGDVRLANFWYRSTSTLIDLVLTVFIPARLIHPTTHHGTACYLTDYGQTCYATTHHSGTAALVVIALCLVANSVVMQGLTGQSAGKRILSIVVDRFGPKNPDGSGFDLRLVRMLEIPREGGEVLVYPGVGVCLFRLLAHFVDVIILIGFFLPAKDPLRQTWADRKAHTYVISEYRELRHAQGPNFL